MSAPNIAWKGQPIDVVALQEIAQELVRATDALAAVSAYRTEQAGNMDEMIDWALERANLALWRSRWTLGVVEAANAFDDDPPCTEADAFRIVNDARAQDGLPPIRPYREGEARASIVLGRLHDGLTDLQRELQKPDPVTTDVDDMVERMIGQLQQFRTQPSKPVTRIPDIEEASP